MSLSRASVLSAGEAATSGLTGKGKSGVGTILSDAFFAIELTLAPHNEPKGHVLCPEINPDMDENDEELWAMALAYECAVEGWYRVPSGVPATMPEFDLIKDCE